MSERIISEERESALICLLDDPSPVVQEALEHLRVDRGDRHERDQSDQ